MPRPSAAYQRHPNPIHSNNYATTARDTLTHGGAEQAEKWHGTVSFDLDRFMKATKSSSAVDTIKQSAIDDEVKDIYAKQLGKERRRPLRHKDSVARCIEEASQSVLEKSKKQRHDLLRRMDEVEVTVFILQLDDDNSRLPWMMLSNRAKTAMRFVPAPLNNAHMSVLSALEVEAQSRGRNDRMQMMASDIAFQHLRYMHDVPWTSQVYLVDVVRRSDGAELRGLVWWIAPHPDEGSPSHGEWSDLYEWPMTAETIQRDSFAEDILQTLNNWRAISNGQANQLTASSIAASSNAAMLENNQVGRRSFRRGTTAQQAPKGPKGAPSKFDLARILRINYEADAHDVYAGEAHEYDDDSMFDVSSLPLRSSPTRVLLHAPHSHYITPSTFDWSNAKLIGGGSYGSVYRVTLQMDALHVGLRQGSVVVVKLSDVPYQYIHMLNSQNEVSAGLALSATDHPNVMKTYGWFSASGLFAIVLESLAYDLKAALRASSLAASLVEQFKEAMKKAESRFARVLKRRDIEAARSQTAKLLETRKQQVALVYGLPSSFKPLDLSATLLTLSQVANGLDHIHGAGYVHRDLKPANVLLDQYGTPKLADFGFTVRMSMAKARSAGSIPYMTPSAIKAIKTKQRYIVVSEPSGDLHSLAMIILRDVLMKRRIMKEPFIQPFVQVARHIVAKRQQWDARQLSEVLARHAHSFNSNGASFDDDDEDTENTSSGALTTSESAHDQTSQYAYPGVSTRRYRDDESDEYDDTGDVSYSVSEEPQWIEAPPSSRTRHGTLSILPSSHTNSTLQWRQQQQQHQQLGSAIVFESPDLKQRNPPRATNARRRRAAAR